jgi:predicted aconitase with swiveling domain
MSARVIVDGAAAGPVLASAVPLSLWGGVDSDTGTIIDRQHPLCGERLAGRILALPAGRGSSAASAVLLELLVSDQGPAGIVLRGIDEVLVVGVIVADELFGKSVPLVAVGEQRFAEVLAAEHADIAPGGAITLT